MKIFFRKNSFYVMDQVVLAVIGVFVGIAYPNISNWITDRNVKKEVYEKYRYDPSLFAEGEVLYMHIACQFKFYFLDKPLVVMTKHEANLGKAFKVNMESHEHSIFRLIRENSLPEESLEKAMVHLCELKIGHSWHAFRVGKEIKWAKKNLHEAFIMDKLGSLTNKYFFLSLFMLPLPRRLQSIINAILLVLK